LDSKTRREKQSQQTLEDFRLQELKEAVIWKDTFGTKDGQKCLELLREKFYDISQICHNDPIVTQNQSARRDLVRYIIDQIEFTVE